MREEPARCQSHGAILGRARRTPPVSNGSFQSDGVIDYVGRRNDDQVKLRGFRVEIGEIESVLLRHPSVKQTSVIAHREAAMELLAAYVVSSGDTDEKLSEHLRRTLLRKGRSIEGRCLDRIGSQGTPISWGREMHWKRCLQRFGWMCSGSSAVAFTATFSSWAVILFSR